jgi:hypothetical protein
MHLHGETLERYARRELPAHQLASLDEHVSNCMFCAHAFAERRAATTSWERRGLLGRLVQVELERAA